MDLIEREREVADVVRGAVRVDPTGSGTHREVGGRPPTEAATVRAPAGIVAYDPADLTVCVGAGTTFGDLDVELAAAGQECALDPREGHATVGGILASGLSGPRRLRVGPLRDQVLEVRFTTADGRLVRGGGPTVKNVTGYDLPRLLVGSFGTLGVMTRVVLRCRPRAPHRWLGRTPSEPHEVRSRLLRPSTLWWDGTVTTALIEGDPEDVVAQAGEADLEEVPNAPELPDGPHRGRISVPPRAVVELGRALESLDVRWLAEGGVGTVHVATDDVGELASARGLAARAGGWLLRELGAPGFDGFGVALPNAGVMERIRVAFDPEGKLAPGRLPTIAPVTVTP